MKKTKSIFYRNFTTTAILLLISFALLGMVFTAVSYRYVIDKETEEMTSDIEEAARMLSAYGTEWDMGGLEVRAAISWLSETTGFHILVCNTSGVVVSCSDRERDCPHIGKQVSQYIGAEINLEGRFYGVTALGGIYEGQRHVVGTTIMSRGRDAVTGYVFLSAATGDMSVMWRQFAGLFFMVAAVVVLLASAMTYLTAKRQSEPIKKLADAAHRFGYGDFAVRVEDDEESTNEMRELADSFNVMADSLERSEQAWRDLIANVAHELKTPMTTITGFADGILDGTIPPEKQPEYMAVISSETKRLNRLVRGMLEMSRVQDANASEILKQSFDVTEVMRRAILSLEKKITDKGLDVEVSLPEEAVAVRGDVDAITQVVYNLIDNAAKFAAKGTPIRLAVWKQENKAYVSVEDTGSTISKEELPLIFDRFHKADKSRSADTEGVGLGLYIVKMIINRHNEDIFVTSEDGVTRFVFTLALKEN